LSGAGRRVFAAQRHQKRHFLLGELDGRAPSRPSDRSATLKIEPSSPHRSQLLFGVVHLTTHSSGQLISLVKNISRAALAGLRHRFTVRIRTSLLVWLHLARRGTPLASDSKVFQELTVALGPPAYEGSARSAATSLVGIRRASTVAHGSRTMARAIIPESSSLAA